MQAVLIGIALTVVTVLLGCCAFVDLFRFPGDSELVDTGYGVRKA